MKLTIPTKWSELTDWQKKEICHLVLQENYNSVSVIQLLKILVMKRCSFWEKWRWFRLLKQVPVSCLFPFAEVLLQKNDLYIFPDISEKLKTPGARMNTCSIKQFSVCDAIYFKLCKTENSTEKEILKRQLVASLYVLKNENKNTQSVFDSLELPKIAEITDKINPKIRSQIVFTYMCVRNYIENRYPKVFPKTKKQAGNEKDFAFPQKIQKTTKYIPFSKVIYSMAMDERQPLGNLHQCNDTLIYDFLDILQESIIRQEEQNKNLKN